MAVMVPMCLGIAGRSMVGAPGDWWAEWGISGRAENSVGETALEVQRDSWQEPSDALVRSDQPTNRDDVWECCWE